MILAATRNLFPAGAIRRHLMGGAPPVVAAGRVRRGDCLLQGVQSTVIV
jgi:hypothetical protein